MERNIRECAAGWIKYEESLIYAGFDNSTRSTAPLWANLHRVLAALTTDPARTLDPGLEQQRLTN